jgi:hypothetical protein
VSPNTRISARNDPDLLRRGSAAPEAITEQPDLGFEHRQEARWMPDVMGLRLVAVAAARTARRRRGESVTAVPWQAMMIASAIVAAALAIGWAAVAIVRAI